MSHIGPFLDIGIILASGLVLGFLFRKFRQSVIPGYLLAGIIIGPHAAGLVRSSAEMSVLGDFGVMLLMFVLGAGFPPRWFKNLGAGTLLATILQILLVSAAFMGAGMACGLQPGLAFLVGAALMMSSTAIVVKVLNETGSTTSVYGRFTVMALVIQDFVAVGLLVIYPYLSKGQVFQPLVILSLIAKALGFIGLAFLLSLRVIPALQVRIASSRSRELFQIGALVFCLGMAVISGLLGLSPALGAFVAGLIISDSEFNTWILAGILPLRDVFLCIFFVIIGMLFNPLTLVNHPAPVLLIVLGIIFGKGFLTTVAGLVSRLGIRNSLQAGFALAQASEFTFIILVASIAAGQIDRTAGDIIMTASLLSMLAAPFIGTFAVDVLGKAPKGFMPAPTARRQDRSASPPRVVICGYGPIGMTIGHSLHQRNIPFVAIDLNYRTVRRMRELGIECIYGDAASPDLLESAGIRKADLAVVTTPDRQSSELIVRNLRMLQPDCKVVVRTRFDRDVDALYRLGADTVVQEESEAGLTMLGKTLTHIGVPHDKVDSEVETIRSEREAMVRGKYRVYLGFSKTLSADRVILDLKTPSKEAAIMRLVEAASKSNKVKDRDEFLRRVYEREEMSKTALGNGIAIPHARTGSVEDVVAAIGLSRNGVDWGAPDGRLVRVVVLFGVNESSQDLYLKTLGTVAMTFNDPAFITKLMRTDTPEMLLHLIREREAGLSLTANQSKYKRS